MLVAQTLWVFSYAALPAFFVLYATESLGLSIATAGLLPLGFGAITAIGIVLAGRARPERVHALLLAGAALLGAGLLSAAFAPTLTAALIPFAAAALGAGMVTTLGFPYFARFVPAGQEGGYSGLFFAGRAVAAGVALPVAGVAVELAGTYRAVLWLGASALLALVPLALGGAAPGALRRPCDASAPASVAAVVPVYASTRVAEVTRGAARPRGPGRARRRRLAGSRSPALLGALADDDRVRLLRLARNGGKGSAVAAGVELLSADERPPEAIVVVDSDGQHDPGRIPAFLEAARSADVVIGSRTDRRAMPLARRIANRAASLALLASTRTWLPGLPERHAALLASRRSARRRHRAAATRRRASTSGRCSRPGGGSPRSRSRRSTRERRATSARSPTPSGSPGRCSPRRPSRDPRPGPRRPRGPASPSCAAPGRGSRFPSPARSRVAALLPALQPLDSGVFSAINGLGDGPEPLYQAFDPHTRNYLLLSLVAIVSVAVRLRRARYLLGTGVALLLAAYLSAPASSS